MAPHSDDETDDSYTVDIGTVQLNSLSDTASPRFSGLPVPDVSQDSFVSRAFPISKDSPEIRVLDLENSDNFDDPLVGTFRIVSLGQECDPYTALSYVWGAPQPTQGITIDLKIGVLSITRNCQDALRQIRHLYGDTTIWVDSICIDQSCETERCHQVSLMGDVYSRAKKVYIWLGQETPGRRRALECVDFAATFMYLPLDRDAAGAACQRVKFQLRVIPPVATFKLLRNWWKRKELQHSYRHADLEELLGMDWFSRIWTFQEVVLATDAIILCGTATLNWSVFARGFRCLQFLLADKDNFWDIEDWRPVRHTLMLRERSIRIKGQEEDSEGMASRPRGFLALQRVLFLWMRVDREGLGRNDGPVYGTCGDSSILWHQRPYIDMSNRHLQKVGLVCTHVVAFTLLCSATLAGVYHNNFTTRESTLYIAACDSLGGLALLVFFLYTTLFNPEGFSSDLNTKRSEQQVSDHLMSAVVETLSYRHAREPKDMSYALYGVLRGFGVDLAAIDYSKPQARIYHELCMDMLKFRSSAISLLLYVNTVQNGQTFLEPRTEKPPTWVPDWSRLETKQFVSLQPSSIPEIYCATEKGLTAVARYSKDQRALSVSGQWKASITFCMGNLQVITDKSPQFLTRSDAMYTSIQAFSGWVDALNNSIFAEYLERCRSGASVGTCEPRSSAVHPATLVFALMEQRSAHREADHELSAIKRMYNIFAQAPQDEESGPREISLQAAQDILTSLHRKDLLDLFVGIINGQAKNISRWFITSNGFLGCGTDSVMPGDRLALVAGVAAPMIFRPLDSDRQDWFDSEYLAVCSAYVSGWMYGEVFEKENLGDINIV